MFIAHQLSSCCFSVLWKSCWWRWFSQKGKQLSRDLCVFRSVFKYPHRVLADKRSHETGGLSDSPMSSLVHSLFLHFPNEKLQHSVSRTVWHSERSNWKVKGREVLTVGDKKCWWQQFLSSPSSLFLFTNLAVALLCAQAWQESEFL